MDKGIISKTILTNIADSIRTKTNTTDTIKPSEMADLIDSISTGVKTQEKRVNPSEEIQIITPDEGYNGLSKVEIDGIDSNYIGSNINKNPIITVLEDTITVPSGYYNKENVKKVDSGSLGEVIATKSELKDGAITVTPSIQNGTQGYITETSKDGTPVTVSVSEMVSGNLNLKPTESTQTDIDVSSYATASVEAISSTYIGSSISKDPQISVSNNLVTIPSGYYSKENVKSVSSITLASPVVEVDNEGLITATVTQTSGYVDGSTTSATKQLVTKDAAIITPSTVDQTIDANIYLIGKQTILGDSDLAPENIASGKTIFSISGTYTDDANATASDIKSGKYAYVKGEKIEGTHIEEGFTTEEKIITPTKDVQEITPSSSDGLSKVTVNAIPSNYIDTTDATAVAKNIQYGTSAYVNGEKLNGELKKITSKLSINTDYATITEDLSSITIEDSLSGSGFTYEDGTTISGSEYGKGIIDNTSNTVIKTKIWKSILGDAATDEVLSGKTFSSSNGYQITGTYVPLDTSDATATANDIMLNKTAYINGEKITGNIETTTLTNDIITGNSRISIEEEPIDVLDISVQIPEGYHTASTLTKSFSDLLPDLPNDATDAYILNGYQAYNDAGQVITGIMTNNATANITLDDVTTSYTVAQGYHTGEDTVSHSTVSIPNPSISINDSGLITASNSWSKGYTTNNSYSNTKQLTTKGATIYTPGTSNQTIASGTYLTGIQTISGDNNLVSANIASGSTIFGVSGSYTDDADATADDIKAGKYAYVQGTKILGTHEEEIFTTEEKTVNPSESIQEIIPDSANGLSKVTVNAISSTYIGSEITKDPTPTVSADTITIPTGYYSKNTTKSVATGSLGTVSASKSTVSNHSITVTPSITGGTAGYISDTSKTGAGIGITASELVSGNKELTASESLQSDIDVTDYATVSVNAISSTYIGSGITQYSSSGNTTLNATTTSKSYPAGYYSNAHGAAHTTVNIPDPTISISSAGLITASGSWTAGFTTDTSYSNTSQLTTKAATTITPTKISQTAVNSGVYTTGAITVAAIPSNYIDTTSADATASDIAESKTAYVNGSLVTGTLTFSTIYSGTSTPSSTTGVNGDIYIKTA